MGIFDQFKKGLAKTFKVLNTDIRDLFKGEGRLVDEAFIEEVFEDLIKIDIGVKAADETTKEIAAAFRARVVHKAELIEHIKKTLKKIMAQPSEPIRFAASGPTVIMVAGVNGAGK